MKNTCPQFFCFMLVRFTDDFDDIYKYDKLPAYI